MLKEVIKSTALILDDQEVLENISQIENANADCSNQTKMYISLVNFVIANIAETFSCYNTTQALYSDDNGKIEIKDFNFLPCNIKRVKTVEDKKIRFNLGVECIDVGIPNCLCFIEYSYVPNDVVNLDDDLFLPIGLDYKAVCYGILSEYFTAKMQYTEASVWEQKFKSKIKPLTRKYNDSFFALRRWF